MFACDLYLPSIRVPAFWNWFGIGRRADSTPSYQTAFLVVYASFEQIAEELFQRGLFSTAYLYSPMKADGPSSLLITFFFCRSRSIDGYGVRRVSVLSSAGCLELLFSSMQIDWSFVVIKWGSRSRFKPVVQDTSLQSMFTSLLV